MISLRWPFWRSRPAQPVERVAPPRDFIEYLERQTYDRKVPLVIRACAARALANHHKRVSDEERIRRIVREELARLLDAAPEAS